MQIFRLLTASMKTNQIPYVIFKPPVSYYINASLFRVQHYIHWTKKYLKVQVLRFLSVPVKFTKLLISFMKPQVILPSKFASIFSIMMQNPSVLF